MNYSGLYNALLFDTDKVLDELEIVDTAARWLYERCANIRSVAELYKAIHMIDDKKLRLTNTMIMDHLQPRVVFHPKSDDYTSVDECDTLPEDYEDIYDIAYKRIELAKLRATLSWFVDIIESIQDMFWSFSSDRIRDHGFILNVLELNYEEAVIKQYEKYHVKEAKDRLEAFRLVYDIVRDKEFLDKAKVDNKDI